MENSAFLARVVSIVNRILLGGLFASLVVGQVIRGSLTSQGGGLLASDIAVVLLLACGVIEVLLGIAPKKQMQSISPLLYVFPFILWSACVLLVRSGSLEGKELIIAGLYWARLTSILLLYPLLSRLFSANSNKQYGKQAFLFMYATLLVLGFIQLFTLPNLQGIGGGWDPHEGRMVSTWLDPNLFGAFLAMFLPSTIIWAGNRTRPIWRLFQWVLFFGGSIAILLTKSRSTYIATGVACVVCGVLYVVSTSLSPYWKKAILPLLAMMGSLGLLGAVLLGERAVQLFTNDPTVAIRAGAYEVVWERIVGPNILLGVGYNAYQFAAKDAGLLQDFLIHSRGGSDSSILTLLATTGVIGTILFLAPFLWGAAWHAALWVREHSKDSVGIVWMVVLLLMHAQFANSLLYAHLLIPTIVVAAIIRR